MFSDSVAVEIVNRRGFGEKMAVLIAAAYYYGAVATIYRPDLGCDVVNCYSYAALISIVRGICLRSVAVM